MGDLDVVDPTNAVSAKLATVREADNSLGIFQVHLTATSVLGLEMKRHIAAALVLYLVYDVACLSITDIQGVSFQSPYAGQFVTNVTGIVTAKVSLVIVSNARSPCYNVC